LLAKFFRSKYFTIACVCLIISSVIFMIAYDDGGAVTVDYAVFSALMEEGEIQSASISTSSISFTLKSGEQIKTINPGSPDLKERMLLKGIEILSPSIASGKSGFAYGMIIALIFGAAFYWKRTKQTEVAKLPTMVANRSVGKKIDFSMVAGQEEVIEGLRDIVLYIKEPESYAKIGARMPKGILLYGPPGTGKTLLAQAMAGEAEVPFLSANGSDFVQMYVGVGAKRIRELFAKAREKKKCVIFIDEIDAIGKRRSEGNDSERDQTLNALLTEMSGFSQSEGIVVLAATNRIDTLDSALLRPGRFDRHIEIGMPEIRAREKILDVILKNKPMEEGICPADIAAQTTGFSGAALESMMNEAAIYAIREGKEKISRENIQRAYISVIAGEDKKGHVIDEKDKNICAIHEAGHAVAAIKLLPQERIKRISIIPSTRGAGGYVLRNISENMLTKDVLLRHIIVAYAGRAAEETFLGKDYVSRGAASDIEKATEMITALTAKYGMDTECGLLSYDRSEGVVSAAKRRISAQLYEQTLAFINESKEEVERVKCLLLDKESLSGEDIDALYKMS
jgi:cell division protease FtsH